MEISAHGKAGAGGWMWKCITTGHSTPGLSPTPVNHYLGLAVTSRNGAERGETGSRAHAPASEPLYPNPAGLHPTEGRTSGCRIPAPPYPVQSLFHLQHRGCLSIPTPRLNINPGGLLPSFLLNSHLMKVKE